MNESKEVPDLAENAKLAWDTAAKAKTEIGKLLDIIRRLNKATIELKHQLESAVDARKTAETQVSNLLIRVTETNAEIMELKHQISVLAAEIAELNSPEVREPKSKLLHHVALEHAGLFKSPPLP